MQISLIFFWQSKKKSPLQSSHSLEKLSLRAVDIAGYGCFLTDNLVNSICENGGTLQVLDLAYSKLTFQQFEKIIKKCVELRELNLDGVEIPDPWNSDHRHVENFLSENITTKIQKLNVSWWNFEDENVKTLVSRCTKISSFNLQITKVTNNSLKYIIDNLGPTLEELHITNPKYDDKLSELKIMPRLKILNTGYVDELKNDELMRLYFGKEFVQSWFVTINKKKVNVAANISPENGIWEIKTKGILA